jgi:hypothetical protein
MISIKRTAFFDGHGVVIMNMKNIITVIISFIVLSSLGYSHDVIFSDGFETGTLAGWNITDSWIAGGTARTGTYALYSQDVSALIYANRSIDTSTYEALNVSFYAITENLDAGEYVAFGWYNGSIWIQAMKVQVISSYTHYSFLLPPNASNLNFKIYFACNATGSGTETCSIDDLNIYGVSVDTEPPNIADLKTNLPDNSMYSAEQEHWFNATIIDGADTRCSQETATVSNACGGLSTGAYALFGDHVNPGYLYDGDWDTGDCLSGDGGFYVNYTIPSDFKGAQLLARLGDDSFYSTINIPYGCFAGSKLQLKLERTVPVQGALYSCLNYTSSAWVEIFSYEYYTGYFYEENVSWIISNISTVLFESNFTGTLQNETITDGQQSPMLLSATLRFDTFLYNAGILEVGTYRYRWFANDNSGYMNNTEIFYYTIQPYVAPVFINISLNSPANDSIIEYSAVNFSFTPVANYNFINCSLFINGAFNMGNSSEVFNNSANWINISYIENQTLNWSVECWANDVFNSSENYTLEIAKPYPVIIADINCTIKANKVEYQTGDDILIVTVGTGEYNLFNSEGNVLDSSSDTGVTIHDYMAINIGSYYAVFTCTTSAFLMFDIYAPFNWTPIIAVVVAFAALLAIIMLSRR